MNRRTYNNLSVFCVESNWLSKGFPAKSLDLQLVSDASYRKAYSCPLDQSYSFLRLLESPA